MIYLHNYIDASNIIFFDENENKSSILEKMIDHISRSPNIIDKGKFKEAVLQRESLMSTGIGLGIAIPHVKIKQVEDITICIGISKKGIEWEAIDNQPVHLIFLMAGAEDQHVLYLKLLSKIILVLRKKERREKLIAANDPAEIISHFIDL